MSLAFAPTVSRTTIDNDLTIIPVINKIDVLSAEPERARDQIRDVIGLDTTECLMASAKEGTSTPTSR